MYRKDCFFKKDFIFASLLTEATFLHSYAVLNTNVIYVLVEVRE